MRYEDILEQVKQADLENVPNHELELTDFAIEDTVNGETYTFTFSIIEDEATQFMQVYVTGTLEFPVGEEYNFNSYDAERGHPLPKLGEITSDKELAEKLHEYIK